ncbi:MAG: hypothetical protein P4M05_10595 [Bradyrhizobium sp.]|nr:hypothetical protein [Bradyrhizobium sp.]
MADLFVGLVANILVGLCASAAEAKGGQGRATKANRPGASQNSDATGGQTNNAAGLK